jgi:hypothetical protein
MRAQHLTAAALVSITVSVLYGRIAWGMFIRFDDFHDHLRIAQHLYETGRPSVPHFLFQGVTAALHSLIGRSFLVAGALTSAAAYFLTGGVTYAIYWKALRGSWLAAPALLGILSLLTLMAQPITSAQTYTLGYLWPEPYHSPTYTMMKPFALAVFAGTAGFLTRRQTGLGLAALFTVATIASALSKPNFVICLLPAALLMLGYRLWRRQPVSTQSLIVALYVPAGAVLAWQHLVAVSGMGDLGEMYHVSASWAPLKFMHYWATNLPAKCVASVLFPVTVTTVYWQLARRDPVLQFAWLCFGFGALYSYGVVETPNWAAGNFVWSGYVTLLTLLVATTVFWLQQAASAEGRWQVRRAIVCAAVFALHILSGVRLTWLYLTHYGCRVDFRLGQYVCG